MDVRFQNCWSFLEETVLDALEPAAIDPCSCEKSAYTLALEPSGVHQKPVRDFLHGAL